MSPRARVAAALFIIAVAFAAVTLYALEGRDVVVLHTRAADGTVRQTRTWVADADGAVWIEAAFPERPFYQDLLANPQVELLRDGRSSAYRAIAVPNPAGHQHIRALLAAKYGWADTWVGLLQDTSRSLAVRLDPP